jgi:hypothetical protein
MKRALYTLANEEFGFFVNQLTKEFKKQEIPHIFVGGTAVQAHILSKLTKGKNSDISSLISDANVRLQDYIRATDDIDIALKFPNDGQSDIETAREIYGVCDSISKEYISDTENYIFEYGVERRGVKRPIFKVIVEGEPIEAIVLNISRKPSDLRTLDNRFYNRFYNKFIDNGQDLIIPHFKNFNLHVRVPKLEHVLATKISQFRAKDSMDIQNLVEVTRDLGEEIKMNEIEEILLPEYTQKYEKFKALINFKE